ncbi:M28 family peptidase [Chitinophaga sp. Mgbs1]|uniref:M28 family peptidase n=1 Tax=Chitinophaga solisilvae TaxID=1233460 RepID=A0A9Q5D837_9BACT|nr:M28 family peptidase [Chitinophaga solisilvae]
MRVFVTIACSLSLLAAQAQVTSEKNKKLPATASVAARYASLITPLSTKKQLAVIAGAEMEGRETGTRGQERAAAYIVSQFREAGLQPGANGKWEQYYPLYRDTLREAYIRAGDKVFRFGEDIYASIREGVNIDTTAEVVYAGYGIRNEQHDDYAGLDVKNKIVLVRDGVPVGMSASKGYPGDKNQTALAQGARALLLISNNARNFKSFDQRQMRRTGVYTAKEPVSKNTCGLYIITPSLAASLFGVAQADSLPALLERNLQLKAGAQARIVFRKDEVDMSPSNVLGYLEGTDRKEEVVFITAHYDHLGIQDGQIHYGADDDGSGTTAVIELARAFMQAKKDGHGPRRSIVFMAVSGEEKGLLGSAYYTEHPVYPLTSTVADLNIDMIGRIDPAHEKDTNYVYVIGDNKLSSAMRPISEGANDKYTGLKLDYKYNDPNDPNAFYYRSDHYNFARHKIPVIFYFNGTHADYHRPTDTVEKIDYHLLTRRAQLVFYTAWDIANRDSRPVVDRNEK